MKNPIDVGGSCNGHAYYGNMFIAARVHKTDLAWCKYIVRDFAAQCNLGSLSADQYPFEEVNCQQSS